MNVLVVSDLWPPFPGGAERLLFNLARDLDRRDGFDVRVVTGYGAAQQFDGPPFVVEPIGIGNDHDQGWELIRPYLRWHPTDVIVTHHLYAYEFEAEFAATGIPIVQIVLNTRRLPGAALAVFISDYVAGTAGMRPGDLIITPPAYDDVISTSTVAPVDRPAIGFIKPIAHKGVDLVYQIAERMPGQEFVILRGEWQTLETIRTDLPNVTYMEPVDDIRDFYDHCRIVLMPSISEDAGTVAQECALNGIPCISSDVGGLPQTNAGGVRLRFRDPAYWVDQIRRLDRAVRYHRVVERQHAALRGTDRDARMDILAERIARLVGADLRG